ncbi:MAG: TonB-dependent receptor plug domain-containing protein [Longimicrobiales bacterium]
MGRIVQREGQRGRAERVGTAAGVIAVAAMMVSVDGVSGQVRDTIRADTAVFRVREIVVQARRPVTTVGGSAAVEVRVDSLVLAAAPTLEQVFRALPMLHVRRNSRGEAEISARGSESRQVAILVDGVPLTLAWDARVDVSVIPATAPQEIGFVRGLGSVLHGPNVLGGVVEIGVGRSFFQPERWSLSLTSGFDHLGGYAGSATGALPFETSSGQWLLRAGASFRDSPGDPLPDGVTDRPGGEEGVRLNTDANNIDGFVAVRYHANSGAWMSFSGASFQAERGIAAELGVADGDARFWRYPKVSRTVAVFSAGTGDGKSPFGGRGDIEASFGLDVGRSEIDAFAGPGYDQIIEFENGDDRTLTLRLLGDQTLGSRADLRGAFTLSEIRHNEFLPEGDATYRQRLWSLGSEVIFRLIENGEAINSLRLSLGGAYDVGETPESGGKEPLGRISEWGGRAGLSMGVANGNALLHAGISRRGRFPALRELYSGALNRFAPNPDLSPERLVAMEAGVTTRMGNGEFQAVVFHHRMKDAIVRVTLPDLRFMRVNRNELESTGLEFLVSQTVGRVSLGGDLTVQNVDLTDTEAEVTNRPENLPETFGSVHAEVPLGFDLSALAEARYTGNQFCIDPGTGEDRELDAGTRLNASLGKVWRLGAATGLLSRLETRVSVDNLADTAIFDSCGLPQAGRLVRVQLRLF